MDRTRKANRERNEVTLQHKSRKEALRIEQLVEEKLAELQASMEQLLQTPEGMAEFRRRVRVFGECQRIEGETLSQFYYKLRRWLEREIPQTRSPRQPQRQVGG
jgi:hypothetical protein